MPEFRTRSAFATDPVPAGERDGAGDGWRAQQTDEVLVQPIAHLESVCCTRDVANDNLDSVDPGRRLTAGLR